MEKQKEISDRLLEERDHCQEAFEQAQQAQQQTEQQRQELWQQLQEERQQLQEARQQAQTLQTALEASRAHTTTLEDQVIYDAFYFALLVQKYYAMYLLF
jgi:chromosome segregation ATPase